MEELSLGWPIGGHRHGHLNRGLNSHSFLKLIWDLDFWPLNRGKPLNRGWSPNGDSTVILLHLTA